MADEVELPVTDPHGVQVVFVNQLVASGDLNNVVNLTFAVAQFTPTAKNVDPDLVIASRLRMDLYCAQQLYDSLGKIIQRNTKPMGKAN